MERVRFTIRLVKELNENMEAVASKLGKSKNDVIVDACWQLVDDWKKRWVKEEWEKTNRG